MFIDWEIRKGFSPFTGEIEHFAPIGASGLI